MDYAVANGEVTITYDTDNFAYQPVDNSGFSVCVNANSYEECDTTPSAYERVRSFKMLPYQTDNIHLACPK